MRLTISNEITIHEPTAEVVCWVREHLVVDNPEYANKQRLGLWLGSTPKRLNLYRTSGDSIIVSYGVYKSLVHAFPELENIQNTLDFAPIRHVNYCKGIKLYPYQEDALKGLIDAKGGILQSKAGSGKTDNAERTVFLTIKARNSIIRYLDGRTEGYLFVGRGSKDKPLDNGYINKIVRTIGERANCHCKTTVHVFRKTFATSEYQRTKNIKYVSILLGHSSSSVTEKYYLIDDMKEVEQTALAMVG